MLQQASCCKEGSLVVLARKRAVGGDATKGRSSKMLQEELIARVCCKGPFAGGTATEVVPQVAGDAVKVVVVRGGVCQRCRNTSCVAWAMPA